MHDRPEGTLRYAQAQLPSHRSNYRQTVDGLWVSSVGLGTYLGQPDDATDADYQQAIDQAVALGCNVIDCAINYRFQRSERAVGEWLSRALAQGRGGRDTGVCATTCVFGALHSELP